MTNPDAQAPFDRYDRRLGAFLRARLNARASVARVLAGAANTMSPAFRVLVAILILWRPTRRRGLRALVAAVLAALLAKRLRDDIARPRPGARIEGGMPSRHAAAAVAIASVLADRRRGTGLPLAVITALGLAGRLSTGEHDPADLVAGALLGRGVARLVTRISAPRGTLRHRSVDARTAHGDSRHAPRRPWGCGSRR